MDLISDVSIGLFVIFAAAMVSVTNLNWFKILLTVTSGLAASTMYFLMGANIATMSPELFEKGEFSEYMIFVWPVITFFVFWIIGWTMRPKK